MFDRWYTFSPAKNSLEAGQATIANGGTAPGTLSSAESDKYIQNQKKLEWAGFQIVNNIGDESNNNNNNDDESDDDNMISMAGIPVTRGPRIILCPAFAICQKDLKEKIIKQPETKKGDGLTITRRSSLVLDGHHLKIDGLSLDGALVIRSGDDTHVTVKNLRVENKGWELTELLDGDMSSSSIPEAVRIRGYTMTKHETAEYLLYEPGQFVIESDGQVRKVE